MCRPTHGTIRVFTHSFILIHFYNIPGAHALLTYKDVQVDPAKRNQMMQTWGQQEQDSLTKRWTRRSTKRMNLQEGLGIDHDEWVKDKKDHQHYQASGQGEQ